MYYGIFYLFEKTFRDYEVIVVNGSSVDETKNVKRQKILYHGIDWIKGNFHGQRYKTE